MSFRLVAAHEGRACAALRGAAGMKILPTAIPDVLIREPEAFGDDRGWFMERYNEKRFRGELIRLSLLPWAHRARPTDQLAPGG